MADYYPPGLTWQAFCKKYAKNNGLTYNQAITTARESYHEYKLAEAQFEAQQRKPKKQVDYDDDDDGTQALTVKKKKQAKQPAKKPKKQVIEDSSSSDDDQDYAQYLKWKRKRSKYSEDD